MKTNSFTFLLSISLLFFVSCSISGSDNGEIITEGDSMSTTEDNNTTGGETTNELSGDFVSEAHPTSGTATVNIDRTELSFTNFKTDDGPRLDVWLSTSRTPTTADTYRNLGELKGIDGNYTYQLPSGVDYEKFNHVVIWCVDFSVSFGYAIVK